MSIKHPWLSLNLCPSLVDFNLIKFEIRNMSEAKIIFLTENCPLKSYKDCFTVDTIQYNKA